MSLSPGTRIAEYTVLKKLGEGGMGEVYLCVHARVGRQVVIKGLRAFHKGNEDLKSRFAREAEVMARLKHDNIVAIYNFLETEEAAYIVMEYVDGVSFDDVLLKRGALASPDAADLLRPVFRAVQFAHEQGVIHRDLKPSNFMIGFDDHVRVLDFGTAKLVDQPGLTRAGTTLGTANYMSPEQLFGKELGPQSDVYALGVVLYEMTTGRLPFEAATTNELFGAIMLRDPTPPTQHKPALPKLIEKVILRCIAKKAEERFATVNALEQALDDALNASGMARKAEAKPAPVTAPPPPSAAPAATARGPIGRARFDPGPLPTRADASLARTLGVAGIISAAAGAALMWHGTFDAGAAAILASSVLSGVALHLAARNTMRLLDVIGHAVVTARAAEEEAKTLAAKLALSAPLSDSARAPSEAAPAPAPAAPLEAPAGGTRRLFATDYLPAVGESLPGATGAEQVDEQRIARTDVWRYAPLDNGAAARIASAAGGETAVITPEAVAQAFAGVQGNAQPSAPEPVKTTGFVEVSSLIPPELRAEFAAAAGLRIDAQGPGFALPPEPGADFAMPAFAPHESRRTAVIGATPDATDGSVPDGKGTAVASVAEIRRILKDMKPKE